MPIGNLMTPPRCPARAAATVIRRQRTAVVNAGMPPRIADTYQLPGWIASGADWAKFSLIFPTADRRSLLISANACIDHYATIRHRQDQVPRTLLPHTR